MKYNDRINKFIELQNKNMDFEDIALEIGIAKSTLRSFLNKNGYKLYNGKYRLKDDIQIKQIEFEGADGCFHSTAQPIEEIQEDHGDECVASQLLGQKPAEQTPDLSFENCRFVEAE